MELTNRRRRGLPVLLLLASALRGIGQPALPTDPPTEDEQRQTLARVHRESLRYQRELPKLVCTQLTTRSVDETGTGKHWKQRDRLEVEDAYLGPFVNHRLLMFNGKDPQKSYQQLTGFLSEAVLYSLGFLPGWLFGPQASTQFEWQSWSAIDGRLVHVFSVHLPASESRLVLSANRQSVVAGIDGKMYVDAATSLVQRLEVELEVPAGSVIQEPSVKIDFGRVAISELQFLLPLKAEVTARVGGSLDQNRTEVVRYQRYGAETKLQFDEPSEGPQPQRDLPIEKK